MLLFFIFTSFPVGSEELIEHQYLSAGDALMLIPERTETSSVLAYINNSNPSYAVEMLYEFPGTGEIDWEGLYFKLRSISRLEEVVYFSDHAGKYRKMFPRAYVIESPKNKKRLPDYENGTPFGDAELYAFLDEVVLNNGRYRVNYNVYPGSIQIRLLNINPLRRFIKVVDKEGFYLDFLFYNDAGKLKMYIYGAFTLENENLILKILKYPYSTLAHRVYIVFTALIGGFHGADLPVEFPDYLRE